MGWVYTRMWDLGYWRGSQKKRNHYEVQDIGGRTILKWILEKWNWVVRNGLIWLKKGTSGGLLRAR
jgi:hypothetical protein